MTVAAEIMLRSSSVCVWCMDVMSARELGGSLCSIPYKFSSGKMADSSVMFLLFISIDIL